jgi:hypothetical protein
MEEFIGEKIEVEKVQMSPRPVRFAWRGESHRSSGKTKVQNAKLRKPVLSKVEGSGRLAGLPQF